MSANDNNQELERANAELVGVRAYFLRRRRAGGDGSAESRAVGNGAGEWPAQQPAMMPERNDRLMRALVGDFGGEDEAAVETEELEGGEDMEGEVDDEVAAEPNIDLNNIGFDEMMALLRTVPPDAMEEYLRTMREIELEAARVAAADNDIEVARLLFGDQRENVVDVDYEDSEESIHLNEPLEERVDEIEEAEGTMRFEETESDAGPIPEVERTLENGYESAPESTSDDDLLNEAFFDQSVESPESGEPATSNGNFEDVEEEQHDDVEGSATHSSLASLNEPSTSSDRRLRKRSSENNDDDGAPNPKRVDEDGDEEEDTEGDVAFIEEPEEEPEIVEEQPDEADDDEEVVEAVEDAVEAPEAVAEFGLRLANAIQPMYEQIIEEHENADEGEQGSERASVDSEEDDSHRGSGNGDELNGRLTDSDRSDGGDAVVDIVEEEEPMVLANPEAPIPDVAPDDEFPAILGLDFYQPEDEDEGLVEDPAEDDVADIVEEEPMGFANPDAPIPDVAPVDEDDSSDGEDESMDEGEEEDEAVINHVNTEERNLADRLRQNLRDLIGQDDIDCCGAEKLTMNALYAALMHECSVANELEDGVVLLHPDVYVSFANGHIMPPNEIYDMTYFREAHWTLIPMLNNAGTIHAHWSIACINMSKGDAVVFDSSVPSKAVKDQRLAVLRQIVEGCVGQIAAGHFKYRYALRNRCIQQAVGEDNEDGIFVMLHARRYLSGSLDVSNKGADCDIPAERQRLVLMIASLRTTLQGFHFRPMAIPPPTFYLPPPPQQHQPYHVVRRDHRVTQQRIRDCYRRLNARA